MVGRYIYGDLHLQLQPDYVVFLLPGGAQPSRHWLFTCLWCSFGKNMASLPSVS